MKPLLNRFKQLDKFLDKNNYVQVDELQFKLMKLAVIGATGMVGEVMLQVLSREISHIRN